jgi:hypothetical protein
MYASAIAARPGRLTPPPWMLASEELSLMTRSLKLDKEILAEPTCYEEEAALDR